MTKFTFTREIKVEYETYTVIALSFDEALDLVEHDPTTYLEGSGDCSEPGDFELSDECEV